MNVIKALVIVAFAGVSVIVFDQIEDALGTNMTDAFVLTWAGCSMVGAWIGLFRLLFREPNEHYCYYPKATVSNV